MKKPPLYKLALYLMLLIYGIAFNWLLYIGPYTTYKVKCLVKNHHQKIVISLTTTPYRITKIKDTLDSLLDQSIKPDQIYLNIPYYYKRASLDYEIPTWLQKYRGIDIKRVTDHGPITKLLPALDYETDPRTIIITVDDDVWYPRHVVRDLVHYAVLHDAVVTPLNINYSLNDQYEFSNIKYEFKHASAVALVVGSAGVAYRRSFFGDDFSDYVASLPSECFLSDDLVISMYLANNKIPIQQTIKNSLHPWIVPFTYKELAYRFAPDAVSHHDDGFIGNPRNYAQCLSSLAKKTEIATEFVLKSAS